MKLLDPRNDIAFKKVFGEHKDLCMSLLNALLPLPKECQIEDLEYLDPNVFPETPDRKNSVVDVRCTDNNGRQFSVEMQMYWYDAFANRVLYNAAKMYAAQIEKGNKYTRLKEVYSLSILNDTFLKEEQYAEHYHHIYEITNRDFPEQKMMGITIVYIELPKFKSENKAHNKMARLWLKFMNEVAGKQIEELDNELTDDPYISKAIDYLEQSSFTEAERRVYDAYWDRVRTESSRLEEAIEKAEAKGEARGLEQGIKEGKEQGIKEGILTAARQMKASEMPTAQIAAILGISEEEVKNI